MSVTHILPSDKPYLAKFRAGVIAPLTQRLPLVTLIFCGAITLPILILFAKTGLIEALAMSAIFFSLTLLYHRVSAARLLNEAKRLRGDNASLVEKLSEEKRAAESARDAAEVSAQAKSTFIANISHEIRTPLNALLGMAQLLERAGLEQPHRDYVKVMLEAGRGLRTLLDDVITLAREDRPDCSTDSCDAGLAARAVVQLLQPKAWEKQLRLNLSVPASIPRVAADPRRVRQVLLKLAENALKFTERGAVDIRLESVGTADGKTHVRFTVADTGLGIPPEVAPHMFQPFALGDGSYARKHQGAGLGLAVAKRVTEQLGGTMGFESEPGQGSTFWFQLPAALSVSAPKPQFLDISGDMPAPSGLTLLIFLRQGRIYDEIVKLLEPFGNRIVPALNEAEAFERISRESFDAIIAAAGDAGILSAVPGRKAPLLALLFPGDRLPTSADEALHWPARPRAFYGVLHRLRGETQKSQMPEKEKSEAPPIDATAFAALERSLGLTKLLEILQSYVNTAETLCEALAQASAESDWGEAGRIAQDIAGAAGGLGLAAMTAAARGFAAQARDGKDAHALRNAAQTVVGEHLRVRMALAHLYPDLAA